MDTSLTLEITQGGAMNECLHENVVNEVGETVMRFDSVEDGVVITNWKQIQWWRCADCGYRYAKESNNE